MPHVYDYKVRAAVRAADAQSSNPMLRAIAAICEMEEDLEGVRAMSAEEHRRRLEAVCRGAVQTELAKAQMGFPPATPDPWPDSTWALLKRLTANVRLS